MRDEVQEFMNEQTQALTDQAGKFRRNPERFMRKALVDSAERLKSLKRPLRMVAHSGVKLTEVSQSTLQNLIELQSEVVTSTLTAVAKRLERAASAEGVADLVFDQIEMLPATRDRIVDEATRAVEILKVGGRDVRKIANHAYATVTGRTDEELAAAKKTPVRKERVVAKREVTSKAAARSASKTLSSSSTGKASKSAAGSALSQRKAPKRTTSPAAASAASKTLRDGRTSKTSKSAAGSALAQKNASRKRK